MCQLNVLDYGKIPGGCGHLWIQGVDQCPTAANDCSMILCKELIHKAIVPHTPLFFRIRNWFKSGHNNVAGLCPSCVKGMTVPVSIGASHV
ncbi:hypothetical protein N7520_002951 [Penicillium odoratum]|uniref:uncharacterized protein n=1 Tax=Penicillium odoratum TaxID=1167516 RepID=UPI0025496837|nr:uncharacterized protein N7520_002951 [Penicillium odoratum]KAJ5772422.1 hypothetical protein N7520_002951 [Penicillium odoratum]